MGGIDLRKPSGHVAPRPNTRVPWGLALILVAVVVLPVAADSATQRTETGRYDLGVGPGLVPPFECDPSPAHIYTFNQVCFDVLDGEFYVWIDVEDDEHGGSVVATYAFTERGARMADRAGVFCGSTARLSIPPVADGLVVHIGPPDAIIVEGLRGNVDCQPQRGSGCSATTPLRCLFLAGTRGTVRASFTGPGS